jgi:hypothetical protein
LTLSALAVPVGAQASDTEHRVALVIGNAHYPNAPLANPLNDARAMVGKLKTVGFDVIEVEDGTQQTMRQAIVQFSNKLTKDTVSLFYYAGHGMQVNGRNYLIPIDTNISTEQTAPVTNIDVDLVISQMSMAQSRVNLVILDACRDNPYERRFRSQSGGLASIDAPSGTLIAYATAPGKTANDGDSGHGLYTSELIAAIDVSGIKVEDVFKRVRIRVMDRSNNYQTPWESSSLTGDFYFDGPPAADSPTPQVATPAPQGGASADREVVLWTSVKDSKNPALIQTYLDQFPQGTFAGAARVLIDDLKKSQLAAVPAKPDVGAAAQSAPAIEEVEGAYVTVKRANVREKPVADGKLLRALDPGVTLTVTGKVKGTQWYRITSADGRLHGFVYGDVIRDVRAAEEADWQQVKNARQSVTVAAFLTRYPSGAHADEARALRDKLAMDERAQQARSVQAQPAVQPAPVQSGPAQTDTQREDAIRNQMFNMFNNIINTIPRR